MAVKTANHDWLELTVEEPLDPDLQICDPHHHLWDHRPAAVAPRYLLDEILDV
jgi:L-fuconolactonase